MSECIEIKYDAEDMEGFMTYVLNMGLCQLFLPVAFIISDKEVIGQYRTDGSVPLSELAGMDSDRALDIMISLMEGMVQAQRRCIFPENYTVNADDLWWDQEDGAVKLIFRPKDIGREEERYADILEMHDVITALLPEDQQGYMKKARGFISRGRSSLEVIRHRFEDLRREAMLCSGTLSDRGQIIS